MSGRADDEALMGVLFGEDGGPKADLASSDRPKVPAVASDEVEPGWGGQGLHAGRVVAARDENTESTPPTILMGGSAEARAAAIAALRADLDLGPPPAPPARVGVSVRVKVRKNTQADEEGAAPAPSAAPGAPSAVEAAPPAPSAPSASASVAPSAPAKVAAKAAAPAPKSGGRVAWGAVLVSLAVAAAWAWVTLR